MRQTQLLPSWAAGHKQTNKQAGVITVSDEWCAGNKQGGELEGWEDPLR